VLAGVLFGLAMLVRYDAALGIAAFLFGPLLKDRRKLLFLLAGFLPVLVFILLFNSITYGGLLSTGYGASGSSLLASTIFGLDIGTFLFYTLMLLALYPLMLAAPYISKKFPYKLEFALCSFGYLLLAARYPPLHFDNSVFTILLRMRYALPLAGLLLIPYGLLIQETINRLKKRKKFAEYSYYAIIAILFIGAIYASQIHNSFINDRKTVFDQIYANTPENSLLIGYFSEFFPERRYLSVDMESNLAGNPENLKLNDFIGENTYIIQLQYGNREGDSVRQDTVNLERQKMDKFIEENSDKLEEVFSSDTPHSLKLFKWTD